MNGDRADSEGGDAARRDRLVAAALAVATVVACLAFRQANFTYNGAAFVVLYRDFGGAGHSHHVGYGWVFTPFLALGRIVGLSPIVAGTLHSAAFLGASLAAFFLWLRRYGIGPLASGLYATLLGLNATAIEIGTGPEMFAASLFATLLALHAWRSLLDRPGAARELRLFLAVVFLLVLHSGFAFWSFAFYSTLAWRDRRSLRRAAAWLATGAASGLVIAVWMLLAGHFHADQQATEARFFSEFWRAASGREILERVPLSFLHEYSAYSGLILLPATFGWGFARRRMPDDAGLFVVASVCFLGFYSFWIPHLGVFYLPLQPIWGLFSALGFEAIVAGDAGPGASGVAAIPGGGATRGGRFARSGAMTLAVGFFAYSLAFLYLLQPKDLNLRFRPFETPHLDLASLHLLVHGALAWAGIRAAARGGVAAPSESAAESDSGPPSPSQRPSPPRRPHLRLCAVVAAGCSLWVYADLPLRLREPDDLTQQLEALDRAIPPDARILTSHMPYRPEATTGRPCIWWPPLVERPDESGGRDSALAGWVRDTARADGPPLVFDQTAWSLRSHLWSSIPALADIPLQKVEFERLREGPFVFYRVRLREA